MVGHELSHDRPSAVWSWSLAVALSLLLMLLAILAAGVAFEALMAIPRWALPLVSLVGSAACGTVLVLNVVRRRRSKRRHTERDRVVKVRNS